MTSSQSSPSRSSRPAWQLPPGVSRGTWDYLRSPSIASDYEDYFATHPLLKLDIEVVRRYLPSPSNEQRSMPIIADFGCGTARVARQLAPMGYRILNVDMSRPMLTESQTIVEQFPAQVASVRGNLAQLDWLRDGSIDMAVCLFSSIGMIRGRNNRIQFLKHIQRCLRHEGRLVVHVHNRLNSLFDPGGPKWLVTTRLRSWFGRDWEYGDRVYSYRGLPSMFLHIYSRAELVADLRSAGFRTWTILPINATASELLAPHTWPTNVRAGGFFAIAS